jgi:hypothetical protein
MNNLCIILVRIAAGIAGGAFVVIVYAMVDLVLASGKTGDRPLPAFGYFVAAMIGATAGMFIVDAVQRFLTLRTTGVNGARIVQRSALE